jgi:hypothetical protein
MAQQVPRTNLSESVHIAKSRAGKGHNGIVTLLPLGRNLNPRRPRAGKVCENPSARRVFMSTGPSGSTAALRLLCYLSRS